MEMHEYQAKALFRSFGIPTLRSELIVRPQQIDTVMQNWLAPFWVLKAQIHAGGRGLAGGIKKAKTLEEVKSQTQDLMGKTLISPQTGPQGKVVHQILLEEGCDIKEEFYLAFLLDRTEQSFTLIVSSEGGMSIEEVARQSPHKIEKIQIHFTEGVLPFQVRKVLKTFRLPLSFFPSLNQLLQALYQIMVKREATLVEVNPLVLTTQGKLLPLDAKVSIDDNALFRRQDMKDLMDLRELFPAERKAVQQGLSFIKLDGNIGCLVNGAGLAMATMDIVKLKGGKPANFLDVGGGVDSEKIDKAFEILKEDRQVEGILVNIFGGIVKCDLIAQGLIKALKLLNISVPMVVRLEGTHSEQARGLLASSAVKIHIATGLSEAADKIVSLTSTNSARGSGL